MSAPDPVGIGARSAAVTVVAQVAARGVTLLAVIAATAIVARTLDIADYADWATVLSLVTLLAFALDPGITPVIVRRLAQEPGEVPDPAATARLRLAVAAAALAVVGAATAALRGGDAVVLALVLGAQVLPRALVLNTVPFLQVDHRLHRQTAWEAVTAGAGLVALAIAAAADAGPVVLAAVGMSVPVAALAVLMQRELRRTPAFARLQPGDDRRRLRTTLAEVAPLAGAIVLVALYTRLHVVFVNAAEDAAGVAHFLFAFQFVEQQIVLAGIVAGALLPLLAARGTGKEILGDDRARTTIVTMAAIGGLVSGAVLLLAAPLTRVIGGDGLADADVLLRLLSPTGVVIFAAFALGYLLMAVQMAGRYLWINLAALLLALALHGIFTLSYGAPAAARTAWITEGFVVALAFGPVLAAGGRRPALQVMALCALAIAGAELVDAGVVAPAVGGTGVLVGTLLLGRRELLWTVRRIRSA